jgi:cell division protein FtsX
MKERKIMVIICTSILFLIFYFLNKSYESMTTQYDESRRIEI